MIYSKFEEIGRATFKWKVTLPNIAYPEHAKIRLESPQFEVECNDQHERQDRILSMVMYLNHHNSGKNQIVLKNHSKEGIDLIKVELKSDEEGHHYPIEKFKGITLPGNEEVSLWEEIFHDLPKSSSLFFMDHPYLDIILDLNIVLFQLTHSH